MQQAIDYLDPDVAYLLGMIDHGKGFVPD